MGSICRLCLHKNDYDSLKNIFEFSPKYFDLNLTEILYWIFDIEIIVEDIYSKLICYKCLNVIETVGRYRKFFQTNQFFLHKRMCPTDFEVKSGWYNTRDIGTNTCFNDTQCVKISANDLKEFNKPNMKLVKLDKSQISPILESCDNLQHGVVSLAPHSEKQPATILQKTEWVNVSSNIFGQFSKTRTNHLSTDTNNTNHRIDIPQHIFDFYPCAQVRLSNLKEDCLKQRYFKVDGQYKWMKDNICLKLNKIDHDKRFLKRYKKIGQYTFKKVSQQRTKQVSLEKKRFLQDYYYRIPTSAIRELLTDKTKEKVSVTSLVKTNEVLVHVCEYCSKVFRFKHNLQDHYEKIHRNHTSDFMSEDPLVLEVESAVANEDNQGESNIKPSSINSFESSSFVKIIEADEKLKTNNITMTTLLENYEVEIIFQKNKEPK